MSYLLYAIAWRILRWLPEKSAYLLGDRIADYSIKKNGKRVQRLRSNLSIVVARQLSESDPLLRKAMRSNLRYWIDTFRFPNWSSQRIQESVDTVNRESFDNAMARGKGLIVALPHAGNWDHAGAFFCAEGFNLVTVAEHLKPDRLFRKFLTYREAMGMEVLDLNSHVMGVLTQRLREGRLIALVADRDLSKTGVEINFFGSRAKFPQGPARLALTTEATLITAFIAYQENGIKVVFSDPIDVRRITASDEEDFEREVVAITQKIADNFASEISKHPEDWHMLQRVFLD
jgi:phosphatidylinositol dimannoside acyltransferase